MYVLILPSLACVSVRRLAPSRYELVLYIYCSCLTSMFPHRNHHSPHFNYPHIISHCMLHVSTVILIHISKAEVSRVNQVPIAGTFGPSSRSLSTTSKKLPLHPTLTSRFFSHSARFFSPTHCQTCCRGQPLRFFSPTPF